MSVYDETTEEVQKRVEARQKKHEALVPFILPRIPVYVRALFDGLYKLDEASQAIVLKEVGRICSKITREGRIASGAPIPTEPISDLDELSKTMVRIGTAVSHIKYEVTNTIDGCKMTHRDGCCAVIDSCACVLVLAGFVDPSPKLCKVCQVGYYEEYLRHLSVNQPISCKATESHTMGDKCCSMDCTFAPT